MQGELAPALLRPLQYSVTVPDQIILSLVPIFINSEVFTLKFKAAICTKDADSVETGAWVSEGKNVSLELPLVDIRFEHFSPGLQVIKYVSIRALHTLLGLSGVTLDYMTDVLDQNLLSDGVFLSS